MHEILSPAQGTSSSLQSAPGTLHVLGGQAGLDGPAGHSTTQVLLKRRAGRNVSCQICLMPNLPHACSTCALETLASELCRQDAASPATTGDPPPLLRPKSQAGWPSRGSCSCGRKCGREMRVSTHYVPSHPGITQTLQAPALELKCHTTRCKTGDRVISSPQTSSSGRAVYFCFVTGTSGAGPCSYGSLPTEAAVLHIHHQPCLRFSPLGSISGESPSPSGSL